MCFASSLCVSSRSSHGDLSILFCRPRLLLKARTKGGFSKSVNVSKIILAELLVVNHVTLDFRVNLSLSGHFYIVTISLFMISDSWQLEIHSDPWPFNSALVLLQSAILSGKQCKFCGTNYSPCTCQFQMRQFGGNQQRISFKNGIFLCAWEP